MYVRDKTKLANIMKRHLLSEMQELVDTHRKYVEDWLKEYGIWGKSLTQIKKMQEAEAPNCKTCKGKGTVRKKWGRGFRNVECPNWDCEDGKLEDTDLDQTLESIIESGSIQEWMKSGKDYRVMDYQDMVYLRDKIREGNYYDAELGTHLDTIVRESLPYDMFAILRQLSSWCENDIAQRNPRIRAAAIARAAYRAAHQKYISIMGERGYDDKQIIMYDELSDAAEEKAYMTWDSECEVMHRTMSARNNCRICGPVAQVVNNPKLWSDSVFWNIFETLKEHNRPRSQVVRDFKAVLNEYDWSGTGLGFSAESFAAESWGGDPEGQLAQALARAREAPAPAPLEITELPKICRTCGDESPQAFGLFDENDNLITESWFCNTVCADQHPIATGQSFGAEGDYNDFISGLEAYLTKFGYLDHLDTEYSNGVLSGSFSVDIDNPEEFGDVEFDAEAIEESDYMVITEDTELPDADSWILYLADPEKFPRGEYDPRFAELFFVSGPGQFVDTNKYIRTARVMGGYAPFMISQNMDETGWLKSPTTIANYLGTDSARSLSVGDIVCNPDTGICYIVANFGYYRLEPTTETFEAPLARHNLHRFRPTDLKKKAGYWRRRGKDSIFGRDKND